jgi:hypothetical protein
MGTLMIDTGLMNVFMQGIVTQPLITLVGVLTALPMHRFLPEKLAPAVNMAMWGYWG